MVAKQEDKIYPLSFSQNNILAILKLLFIANAHTRRIANASLIIVSQSIVDEYFTQALLALLFVVLQDQLDF